MGVIREFRAFVDCPGCGKFDHHKLDSPWPPPAGSEVSVAAVTDWVGDMLSEHYSTLGGSLEAYAFNTDTCDVIRVCAGCGSRWGEK